jgi:hypothetical protein
LGVTEGVGDRFQVLRSRTHFWRWRRGSFSLFALPDSFWALPRVSGLVFMFCAPGLFLGVTEGVASRIHVLCSRTRSVRYRLRRVPFSCFALPNTFLAVTRTSGPVFMFCAPGLVLGGIEDAGSRFHVCAPRLASGGTEGTGSRFHVLRSRTRFGRYRWRWVSFICFALPNSFWVFPRALSRFHVLCSRTRFWTVLRASALVFMFCAPGLFLGVTEGVGARFQVLRSRTRFWRYRGCQIPFSCFALPDTFFGGTEGVGSRFHVLRSQTLFGRHRGRRGSFSCFALQETF